MDDTDALLDDLAEWKRPDLVESRPQPMVIEVYVDTAGLSSNQALVFVDDAGKRWDVCDALSSSSTASSPRPPHRSGGKGSEVVLERWTIELGDKAGYSAEELNDQLANVYKKGVVLFRSLYTFLHFLPAWKLYRRFGRQPGNGHNLRLKYRIREGGIDSGGSSQGLSTSRGHKDSLYAPLCPSELATSLTTSTTDPAHFVRHHVIPALHCPAGPLLIRADYRLSAEIRVVDSEALLSSRFLSRDQGLPPTLAAHQLARAGGSLPAGARASRTSSSSAASASQTASRTQYGSAADPRTTARQPRALLGAYGSLGTFHGGAANIGKKESPLSEIQHHHVTADTDDEDEERASMDRLNRVTRDELGREILPSKDEVRREVLGSSPSSSSSSSNRIRPRNEPVRFNGKSPFKAGSLGDAELEASSPRSSSAQSGRSPTLPPTLAHYSSFGVSSTGSGPSSIPRDKRVSLNTLPQQALRAPGAAPLSSDTAIASSASSSPKPAPVQRYSSSFANRPRRQHSTSGSQATGRGSAGSASSSTRNSASDAGAAGPQSDEESIAEFVRLLEGSAVKNHALTRPSSRGSQVVNLSKYSALRDGGVGALADEMSASSLINASSTPPSRRLSNVPGLSTSSSPSRGALAHQPHVRSRLSAQSIVEARGGEVEEEEDDELPFIFRQEDI
ncbi:hypothetical protein EJ03DRAFT_202860 [Teratosphaeria nubilosa]|uniref:Autophagy-related protein 13 n=1 Tax=Teratosphaeria nubilosa TaxID=161662 RepID=A0A6G1LHD9_9PEZI|nr:hypothetical protein EJ03DRAFT_202860 [Teratosphaeria nubilosa]